MENLSPSNDTLANGDDAHKGVMCGRSTFFKKELVYFNSCHASSCKKCDIETKTESKMTDHVVTHRIEESPDDNGKTIKKVWITNSELWKPMGVGGPEFSKKSEFHKQGVQKGINTN